MSTSGVGHTYLHDYGVATPEVQVFHLHETREVEESFLICKWICMAHLYLHAVSSWVSVGPTSITIENGLHHPLLLQLIEERVQTYKDVYFMWPHKQAPFVYMTFYHNAHPSLDASPLSPPLHHSLSPAPSHY